MVAEKRNAHKTSTPGRAHAGAEPCKTRRVSGAHRMRLERIRKEIENGTYETEGKLRIAITRLIDDVLGRRTKDRC